MLGTQNNSGPGSSVGMATDGLDGQGSNPGGDKIFRTSRPALGPTQPPVKWVPGLSWGVKCGRGVLLTTHPLLVPRSWKSSAIPLPTLWATPGLWLEHFTFTQNNKTIQRGLAYRICLAIFVFNVLSDLLTTTTVSGSLKIMRKLYVCQNTDVSNNFTL